MTLIDQFIKETGNKIPISDYYLDWFKKYSKWLESRCEKFEVALNPRRWSHEQDKAWHINIPNIHKAFEELRKVSLK